MKYEEIVHQFQSNVFGTLTTIRSQKDKNLIWFIAKEIQDYLGYVNITQVIKDAKLRNEEKIVFTKASNPEFFDQLTTDSVGSFGKFSPSITFISESGLYKLIMHSNKPEAENFQHWIASEILPSLRVAVEADLKIKYKLNDIGAHLDEEYQKFQSKKINYYNIINGGIKSAIDYNRKSCKDHYGKTPSQLKSFAKKTGMPSVQRTSGKSILRVVSPETAASMSLTDDLTSGGIEYKEALRISNVAGKELFRQLIEAGVTPNELTK